MLNKKKLKCDFCVVGGGMAGIIVTLQKVMRFGTLSFMILFAAKKILLCF